MRLRLRLRVGCRKGGSTCKMTELPFLSFPLVLEEQMVAGCNLSRGFLVLYGAVGVFFCEVYPKFW